MNSARIALLVVVSSLLPGCELLMMRHIKNQRLGDGGPYAQEIHLALHNDQSYAPNYFTGMLPVSLDAGSGDPRIRVKAHHERRGTIELSFERADAERMCFSTVYAEKVFDDGPKETERVERNFRSYKLAVELSGAESSDKVAKRSAVFPRDNASLLDQIELLDQSTKRREGELWMFRQYRLCGPMLPPAASAEDAKFLTVAVQPALGVELSDKPYLLVWQLFGA